MTVKKSLQLLDFLIDYETRMHTSMSDPSKSWNIDNDSMHKLTKTLSDCHKDNIRVLNIIKKELVTNCKHPKKMRDQLSNGQQYCTNCNLDI
jgi:hypothetical protein